MNNLSASPTAKTRYTSSLQVRAAAELERRRRGIHKPPLWQPNPDKEGIPNPQRLALESLADILGYGGAAGGGKTSLALGLAATRHKRTVIFRRTFPNLRGVIEESRRIFNPEGAGHGKDTYNESLHRWIRKDDPEWMLEFESCQYEKDKYNQRGRPRDCYVFDEATEFTRSQVEFIIGWLRTTIPGQRCRVLLTFNPPSDEGGTWIIDYFLPWIAYLFPNEYQHHNPAAPGELRWYAMVDGKETERENGESFEHNGQKIKPLSRTFIPAKLSDNPFLFDTNYGAVLQSLPEPLRSQMLYGDFAANRQPDPWQVIPTAWVKAAQKRWAERARPITPLSAVGVDAARGGPDNMTIALRYDNWFDEVIKVPGTRVDDGPTLAAITRQKLGEEKPADYLNIDVIGVGSSGYDSLKVMYKNVVPVNAGAGSEYRDKSKTLKMRNVRAEYYWRMREALDPVHGEDLALPPGNELVADLCAARYTPTTAGIQIEDKDEIKKRIGRSPDVGEAILLAYYSKKRGSFVG